MLKNYWRIIARNKIYSTINVLGLALGICGCVVLYLITDYEFSFDRHRPDGERIYRIVGNRVSFASPHRLHGWQATAGYPTSPIGPV
jgi:putative ABC transport system permease protein